MIWFSWSMFDENLDFTLDSLGKVLLASLLIIGIAPSRTSFSRAALAQIIQDIGTLPPLLSLHNRPLTPTISNELAVNLGPQSREKSIDPPWDQRRHPDSGAQEPQLQDQRVVVAGTVPPEEELHRGGAGGFCFAHCSLLCLWQNLCKRPHIVFLFSWCLKLPN